MAKQKRRIEEHTVQEVIFISYANMAMAHAAVANGQSEYNKTGYMIRARLLKGLMDGKMNIASLFDDEKVKLSQGHVCSYCGSSEMLALDHIFAIKLGGIDSGDNLILACRSCNSSKGKKDLMEWMTSQNKFPPLLILRRYLKLVFQYCTKNGMMNLTVENMKQMSLPFKPECIPFKYPNPSELILTREKIT